MSRLYIVYVLLWQRLYDVIQTMCISLYPLTTVSEKSASAGIQYGEILNIVRFRIKSRTQKKKKEKKNQLKRKTRVALESVPLG